MCNCSTSSTGKGHIVVERRDEYMWMKLRICCSWQVRVRSPLCLIKFSRCDSRCVYAIARTGRLWHLLVGQIWIRDEHTYRWLCEHTHHVGLWRGRSDELYMGMGRRQHLTNGSVGCMGDVRGTHTFFIKECLFPQKAPAKQTFSTYFP